MVDLVNRLEIETRNGRRGRLAEDFTRMSQKETSVCLVDEVGQVLFERKAKSDPGGAHGTASQAGATGGAHQI